MHHSQAKDKESEQAKLLAEATADISILEKKIKLLSRLATGGGRARDAASPEF